MQGLLIVSITEHLAAANILVQNMAGEIKYKFVGITNEGASVSGQRASRTLPPFKEQWRLCLATCTIHA